MMVFRFKLKASVLLSALSIMGGLHAPALAAPDNAAPAAAQAAAATPPAFYPATPWDVKTLQDPASGAKICTVASLFNNGFFIQMTAAQEGINSISINFRQAVFGKGVTANVGISAPGVMKKVLPAVAFKPELLAIDFQGQGALFEAVKTAGVMDFSMGADNQFRFYLNGFAAALPRFADCIKNHASAAAGADIPVPVLEIPSLPGRAAAPVASAAPAAPAAAPQAAVKAVKAVPTTPALSILSAHPPVETTRAVPAVPVTPPRPPAMEGGTALNQEVPDEAPVLPPLPLEPARKAQSQAQPAQGRVPRAAAAAPAASELAPKGPPNGRRLATGEGARPVDENPLDPRGNATESTVLRSANIDQERGRAPPPPPRRLSEIEAPPVFTNAEPVIAAPSAEAIAKSRAALDKYEQEMMMVMPPEEREALSSRLKNPDRPAGPAPALEITTIEQAPAPEAPPPVRPRDVPPLEVITPEGESLDSGVLKSGPRRPPIKGRRLSEMLVNDMAEQHENMSHEGRLRPDIRKRLEEENAARAAAEAASQPAPAVKAQKAGAHHATTPVPDADLSASGPQYELKPLVAPLIKRGSAEEKALADILSQPAPPPVPSPSPAPAPASPPQAAAPAAPPTPVLPHSAPGVMARPLPAAPVPNADAGNASPVLKLDEPSVNSVTVKGGEVMPPKPATLESGPRVTRQTKRIEVDLTDVNKPPEAAEVMPRQGKSWLDILREKQEAENAGPADLSPDAPQGVYIPGPPAASSAAAPSSLTPEPVLEKVRTKKSAAPAAPVGKPAPVDETVDIGRVPARTPRAHIPALTPSKADPYVPPAPPAAKAQPSPQRPALYPTPEAALAVSGGAASSSGGGVLENKVRILEQQLSALVKENIELEAELAASLEQGKQEKVAIESDNWNLEESTRLYSEAKMQIDRLGAQIQKERAQCTAEKKELEAMLFDPQVTQEAQLARLAQLEDALNDAQRKLEEQRQIYEGRIRLLQGGAP